MDPVHAERLAEYNSAFLERATYAATRFRIVKPNIEVLAQDGDITITPFDDVELVVRKERMRRDPYGASWHGIVQTESDPLLDVDRARLGLWAPPSATIHLSPWDLDESGHASMSVQNQFQFSPRWSFDEFDNPVLRPPQEGEEVVVGRPPRTELEIANHKRLLRLDKQAFESVTVNLSVEGTYYYIRPLKFTPRYSVVIEIDPNKVGFVRVDGFIGQETRSPEELAQAERYRRFVESLPREESKTVMGDL